MEKWKAIEGFESDYMVSDLGRVKSIKFSGERVLSANVSGAGYLALALCKNGKKERFYIHRLVAEAFIDNAEGKPQVNHKNEEKTDNRVLNLEWVTSVENVNHGTLSQRKSRKVIQYSLTGGFIKEWDSMKEAENEGFLHSRISLCCSGKAISHKGFFWKYKD